MKRYAFIIDGLVRFVPQDITDKSSVLLYVIEHEGALGVVRNALIEATFSEGKFSINVDYKNNADVKSESVSTLVKLAVETFIDTMYLTNCK